MKMKKYWFLVLVLAICEAGLWTVCAWAKTRVVEELPPFLRKANRANLQGLSGLNVYVGITGHSREAEKDGLRQSSLQTDVEVRLRQAGIKIFTEEENAKVLGRTEFVVELTLIKHQILEVAEMYFYTLDIHLSEQATLMRNPSRTVWADSWVTLEWSGTLHGRNFTPLRDKLRDVTDEFINDYLAANPKEELKTERR